MTQTPNNQSYGSPYQAPKKKLSNIIIVVFIIIIIVLSCRLYDFYKRQQFEKEGKEIEDNIQAAKKALSVLDDYEQKSEKRLKDYQNDTNKIQTQREDITNQEAKATHKNLATSKVQNPNIPDSDKIKLQTANKQLQTANKQLQTENQQLKSENQQLKSEINQLKQQAIKDADTITNLNNIINDKDELIERQTQLMKQMKKEHQKQITELKTELKKQENTILTKNNLLKQNETLINNYEKNKQKSERIIQMQNDVIKLQRDQCNEQTKEIEYLKKIIQKNNINCNIEAKNSLQNQKKRNNETKKIKVSTPPIPEAETEEEAQLA